MWMSLAPRRHRVGQEAVDELDDRRVVDLRLGGRLVLQLRDDLDVLALPLHVLEDVLELLVVPLLVVPVDDRAERVLPREHREDVVARDELEVLDHPHVRRVGHRHRQRAPLALERQHHLLVGQVGGDQLEDLGVHLEARQVHRRHPVLPGQDLGDLQLGHQPELDEDVPEAMTAGALLREGLIALGARQQPLPDKHVSKPLGVGGHRGRHAREAPRWWMPGKWTGVAGEASSHSRAMYCIHASPCHTTNCEITA